MPSTVSVPKKPRVYALDFVRTVAACLVVLFHWNESAGLVPDLTKPTLTLPILDGSAFTMGMISVSVFFILTGASLMYTYEDDLRPAHYIKHRFLAIYPMFWLCYFLTYLLYIRRGIVPAHPGVRILMSVIGMDGYLLYLIPSYYLIGEWFLGCILILYVIFPLLRYCMLRWPVKTAMIYAVIFLWLTFFYPFRMPVERFFGLRCADLLIGMYFIHYGRDRLKGLKKKPVTILGILSTVMLVTFPFIPEGIPHTFAVLWTGIPVFFFLVWIGSFIPQGRPTKILRSLSGCTFALFLVHHVIMRDFLQLWAGQTLTLPQTILYFVFCLLICIGAAYIVRFADRWIRKGIQLLILFIREKLSTGTV